MVYFAINSLINQANGGTIMSATTERTEDKSKEPTKPEEQYQKAEELYKQKDYKRAAELFQKAADQKNEYQ